MKYRDIKGNTYDEAPSLQDRTISVLYKTFPGRLVLKLLTNPGLSIVAGKLLSTGASTILIDSFVHKNGIRLSEYEPTRYTSFNDFFTRKIKKGARPVYPDSEYFVSPADGKISVYDITKNGILPIKGSNYTLNSLLRSDEIADEYLGGKAVVIRLGVTDYHRYIYPTSGKKTENCFIPGVLHTVNPIALLEAPVFTQNSREYTIIESRHFGEYIQMEVGAMMVGRIKNFHGAGKVKRGQEKGCFEFGGSTIVLLFKKNSIRLNTRFRQNTLEGYETIIRQGCPIGRAVK